MTDPSSGLKANARRGGPIALNLREPLTRFYIPDLEFIGFGVIVDLNNRREAIANKVLGFMAPKTSGNRKPL